MTTKEKREMDEYEPFTSEWFASEFGRMQYHTNLELEVGLKNFLATRDVGGLSSKAVEELFTKLGDAYEAGWLFEEMCDKS